MSRRAKVRAKVKAPLRVIEGIEAVRETESVDMQAQVEVVRSLATGLGFPEVAFWIGIHPDEYVQGLKYGFEADPDTYIGRIGGWGTSRNINE